MIGIYNIASISKTNKKNVLNFFEILCEKLKNYM